MKTDVISSAIKNVEYDENTAILDITFHNGTTYRYYAVNENIVNEMLNANSIGNFFNEKIKNNYTTYNLKIDKKSQLELF